MVILAASYIIWPSKTCETFGIFTAENACVSISLLHIIKFKLSCIVSEKTPLIETSPAMI